jgi:FkbM family methyltransferase
MKQIIINNGREITFDIRPNTFDEFILQEIFKNKCYSRLINPTLTKNDRWLDIGACFGAFALSICNDVNNVYCCEPANENFKYLQKNIFLNNVSNIERYNGAVVGISGLNRIFYLNKNKNKGSHSFLVKRGRKEIKVNCVNINDIIKISKANKIKLDCEGMELEILNNMDFTSVNEIIFEFHFDILCKKDEKCYWDLIDLLKTKYDYVKHPTHIKARNRIVYCKDKK